MAVAQGYGKTVTSGSVFAYDTGDTSNSYIGEPTTNVATGTLTPYTPYNTMTRSGQDLTITMVGGSALYLTFHNGTDYNGQTITLSGYMFKNGIPHTLPNNRANTYHTVAASKWYFDSVTGYFEIVEVCNASSIWLFHTPSGASGGDIITILDFQVEVKTHATPFVNGTRSSTQGLLPVVGNSTIDLSNVSFDSNAQIVFDGTDDYVNVGDTTVTDFSTGDFTVECVVKIDSSIPVNNGYYKGIVVKKGAGGANAGFGIYFNTGYGKFLWSTANGSSGSEIFTTNTWNSLKGSYAHVVMVRQNGATNNGHFYINGIYESIASSATVLNVNNDYNLTIGASSTLYSAYYFQGQVPTVKIYNRALSAGEVRQNYLHYKTRFNLS